MEEKAQSLISKWGGPISLGVASLLAIGTGIAYYNYSQMKNAEEGLKEQYKSLINLINEEFKEKKRLSKEIVSKIQEAMVLKIREEYLTHIQVFRDERRQHLLGSQKHSQVSEEELTDEEKGHLEKYVETSLREFNQLFEIYETGVKEVIKDCESMKGTLVSAPQIMSVILKIDQEVGGTNDYVEKRHKSLNQLTTELKIEEWSLEKFESNKVHKEIKEDVDNFGRMLLFRNKLYKQVDLRGVEESVFVVIKKKIVSDILACETGIESEDLAYVYTTGKNLNGVPFSEDKTVKTLNREFDLLILNDRLMNTSKRMAENFVGKMKEKGIDPEEFLKGGEKVETKLSKD